MGLSSLPTAADAFFPFALLAYALLPVAKLVGGARWAVARMTGFGGEEESLLSLYSWPLRSCPSFNNEDTEHKPALRVHVTSFESLRHVDEDGGGGGECCVCLHGFEAEEEVSQVVACGHFFHRECLERWLSGLHSTCPLCRSTVHN